LPQGRFSLRSLGVVGRPILQPQGPLGRSSSGAIAGGYLLTPCALRLTGRKVGFS